MASRARTRLSYNTGAALLVTLALVGMVLAAATVPHAHVSVSAKAGLFNHEHDLSSLAALGSVASLSQADGVVVPVVVAAAMPAPAVPGLVTQPGRHQDSRAPPLR